MRGVAVCYVGDRAMCGALENLSPGGALVRVDDPRTTRARDAVEVELKLGTAAGRVGARTVRVTPDEAGTWHVAVAFERVDDALRAAIELAIAGAMRAAKQRPVLVIDERPARRRDLVAKLSARGMSPLAPRTPLEAIDALARAQLHVDVCLLAPSFGHSLGDLRTMLAHSFPWVAAADIADDLDATVDRALDAWSTTAVARLASAS